MMLQSVGECTCMFLHGRLLSTSCCLQGMSETLSHFHIWFSICNPYKTFMVRFCLQSLLASYRDLTTILFHHHLLELSYLSTPRDSNPQWMDGFPSSSKILHQGIGIWKYCVETPILFLQSLDVIGQGKISGHWNLDILHEDTH